MIINDENASVFVAGSCRNSTPNLSWTDRG